MRKLIYILTILTLTTACRSHKFNENHGIVIEPISDELKKKIKVLELEKSTGVIFPAEYEINFNREQLKNRFTPTEQEIRNAETEIGKQYLDADRKFIYDQVYVRTEEIYGDQKIDKQQTYSDLMKWPIKEAKRSPKFDRQYIGFIENGDKKLLVQFIDFSKDPYNLKDQLTNSYIGGWHGWFETNVRKKVYNLNTKKLTVF